MEEKKWLDYFSAQDTIYDTEAPNNTKLSTLRPSKKRPLPRSITNGREGKHRHVQWKPDKEYTILRAGVSFENDTALAEAAQQDALEESHLFLFIHMDPQQPRSDGVPRYEAVFYCKQPTPHYVRAQKGHLNRIYTKMGRVDHNQCWNIEEDGTPYWVCRYAFCKQKQRETKRRYDNRNKK